MKVTKFTIILTILLLLSKGTLANDSAAVKGLGGIRLTTSSNIEMLSEDLFVSERRIEVTYKFRNKSKKKVTTIVAFPLPDIPDLVDSSYHIPDSNSPNFVGFKAIVDGTEIKPKIENRVFYDDRDITELLDQLRLPYSSPRAPYKEEFKSRVLSFSEKERELIKTHNISGIVRDYTRVKHGWTLKTKLYWEQEFEPEKTVTVFHSYQPMIGGRYSRWGDSYHSDMLEHKYCIDDYTKKGILKKLRPKDRLFSYTEIKYILTTGANWSGPIKSFNLVLDKGSTEKIISLCMPGIRKISPTQFSVEYKDFVPKEDLSVVIIRAER